MISILINNVENKLMKESLKHGKLCFKALGSSMLPLIRSGDLVTIVPFNLDELSIGDIVFFEKEGNFYLHRFLKRNNKNEIITKGDNLPNFDAPVNSENILGKLTSIKRGNQVINLDSNWNKTIRKLITVFYPLTYPVTIMLIKSYQLIFK